MERFARQTWEDLESAPPSRTPEFDLASIAHLPRPARRFLTRALPEGSELTTVIELEMSGEIQLNHRWLPFEACQILRAGIGFVWRPVVGRGLMRFSGADAFGPGRARTEFRLFGVLPVARARGPEVARSAVGRLAAETVAWLPQALTPQRNAVWRPIDEARAAVTLDVAGESVEVEVTVSPSGRLVGLSLQRWDSTSEPATYRTFGGAIDTEYVLDGGVRVAGSGTVGWDHGTPDALRGEFFRFSVTGARPAAQRH